MFWSPDAKNWFIGKDTGHWERLNTGGEGDNRGWDVGWHHWLNGHEFEPASGIGDGQGSPAGCCRWGCKEWDTTEWLNSTGQMLN